VIQLFYHPSHALSVSFNVVHRVIAAITLFGIPVLSGTHLKSSPATDLIRDKGRAATPE